MPSRAVSPPVVKPQRNPPIREGGSVARMRILQVAHNFVSRSRGGVEVYTHDLAVALRSRGAEVVVVHPEQAPDGAVGIREERVGDLPVHVISVPELDQLGVRRRDAAVEEVFSALLEQERPDVVHFQHTWMGLPFSLLPVARGRGTPVCLTLHDAWFACSRTHLYVSETDALCAGPEPRLCARCVARLDPAGPRPEALAPLELLMRERRAAAADAIRVCDHVTVPTRYLLDELAGAGLPVDDVELCRLGIRTVVPRARPSGPGRTRFGFLGNPTRLKNPVRLARAFSQVRGDATLLFAGAMHPETAAELEPIAASDPRIQLRGGYWPGELDQILAELDAVVMPSRIENYPLAAREALSAGVPVLAARTGGLGEIVEHGVNGLLFDPTSEAEMRELLQAAVDSPDLLASLRAGIRPVKDIETDAGEWMERYERLCRPRIEVAPGTLPCSVVIPVYNRVDLTRQCIESLFALEADRPAEVVVSDDGSSDETPAYLASLGSAVRVVRSGGNGGFARACNAGAAAASQEALVLLNNDTIPCRGWLRALLEELADPGIGIAGSKLLYPDGTIQHAGVAFGRMTALPYHLYAGAESSAPCVNHRRELRAVTGACLLLRRSLWEELEGLDAGYLNGFEDIDLCMRAAARGWRIVYQPRSLPLPPGEPVAGTQRAGARQRRALPGALGRRLAGRRGPAGLRGRPADRRSRLRARAGRRGARAAAGAGRAPAHLPGGRPPRGARVPGGDAELARRSGRAGLGRPHL